MIVKLILNLILVPIPSIGVNGAAIASVACHLVAFMISIAALKRTIKQTRQRKTKIAPLPLLLRNYLSTDKV